MKYKKLRYTTKRGLYGIQDCLINSDQMVSNELYVQNTGAFMLCAVDEDGNIESVSISSTYDHVIHEMYESGMPYFDILRSFKI